MENTISLSNNQYLQEPHVLDDQAIVPYELIYGMKNSNKNFNKFYTLEPLNA